MPVSFDKLRQTTASPSAQRALWHLLSVGTVWRDEIERHQGADKAGLHLFWVRRGTGWLETSRGRWPLRAGLRCWLVDLRHERAYMPDKGARLVTESFRFNGPMPGAWLEMLDGAGEIVLNTAAMRRLRGIHQELNRMASRPSRKNEWCVHELLTQVWGEMIAARRSRDSGTAQTPPAVERVVNAVHARPQQNWQANEMARIAGVSYSGLRAAFKSARGETLHDFLQRVRLDEALALLSDSRLSVKEVSGRLNFRSETYFTHWFRELCGQPPGAHRQILRG